MRYLYIMIPLITFLVIGCTKDFEKINTNPTAANAGNFDPNYMLSTAQLTYTGSTDFAYETWRSNLMYCSTIMQQLSHVNPYWAGEKYLFDQLQTSAYFEKAYNDQVRVISDLFKITEERTQYKNLHQISRIMRAMILQRITDLYGDVPYFNAGFGYYTKNYYPEYDKQEVIYNDLLVEIEDATEKLDVNADRPSGDLYYKGDIDKWKRFGYSLLLRTAMRLTKIDPAKVQAYVSKVEGKTMLNNGDNAIVYHDISGDRQTSNRVSIVLNLTTERPNVKLSKTYIDFLKSNNDPRLSAVAELDNGDSKPLNQKGMPNGYDFNGGITDISHAVDFTSLADYSRPSKYLVKMDGPTFVLTYAETELLLADAAKRWGIGDAKIHYENGVKGGITYFSQYDPSLGSIVNTASAEAYLEANPYIDNMGLEMINNQFWIATLFNGYEAWSNWRRTGYPILTPINYPGNATNGTIPRRFPYPISEAGTNAVNYKLASESVPGGDNLTSRVWWDKN